MTPATSPAGDRLGPHRCRSSRTTPRPTSATSSRAPSSTSPPCRPSRRCPSVAHRDGRRRPRGRTLGRAGPGERGHPGRRAAAPEDRGRRARRDHHSQPGVGARPDAVAGAHRQRPGRAARCRPGARRRRRGPRRSRTAPRGLSPASPRRPEARFLQGGTGLRHVLPRTARDGPSGITLFTGRAGVPALSEDRHEGPPCACPLTASTTRSALGVVAAGALLLAAAPTASAVDRDGAPAAVPACDHDGAAASVAAYAATRPPTPGWRRPHLPRDDHPVRHVVQRCGGRRGVQRDGLEQERHHRQAAGLDEQARHRVQRPDALGPDKRFTTRVRTGSASNRVIVQGSGDPSLTSARSSTPWRRRPPRWLLGGRSRRSGSTSTTTSSRRRRWRTAWKASYVPDSIAPVRALVRDQRESSDTSAEAAATSATGSRPTA